MNFSILIDKLKQYPLALTCAVLILVFIVVLFLRGGVAAELAAEEAELDARIRTINENIKNSKNLEQDTAKLNAMVEEIDALLFSRDERAMNINFFYNFEDETDVVISNISQLPQPDPIYADGGVRDLDLHATLVYSINLSGSFSNILRFLYEIYRDDHFIRVADFQIAREEGEMGGASVDARLRVLVLAEEN